VLAAGALWFARSGADAEQSETESVNAANAANPQITEGRRTPGRTNAGPGASEADQTRRFRDFTPEQRVEQARKGHGPGG
jgi:hypothetical protein